ncbi:MAG: cell division protein FtsL [Thioalkalispiraceae bacterium]|jgi:cell division protein FtsL
MKAQIVVSVLVVVVVMSALGVVYAKHQGRKLFVELKQLEKHRDQMNVEWGQLQLELNTWASHARIEEQARKRLDMTGVEHDKVIFIKP